MRIPSRVFSASCRAKVNLSLEVLGRRSDGYHEISSLAHTITLADVLSVRAADVVTCEVAGLRLAESENLVLRAAAALQDERTERGDTPRGADIRLSKHIPAAAGLGGGSTDAAAALVLLARLWRHRPPPKRMVQLALGLGSDVPFFLRGGAAVLLGRGERLAPLSAIRGSLVLLVPERSIGNKTAALYQALQPADFTDGSATLALARSLEATSELAVPGLRNAFERPARALFPGLDELWREAERRIDRKLHLSGAGPTLFAPVGGPQDASLVRRAVSDLPARVLFTRFTPSARGRAPVPYR